MLIPADKCPSQNAAARDKNRDGCLDKLPPKRIKADATLSAAVSGGTRIVSLKVSAPKGTKVTVRCGRGCNFAKRASASVGKPLALASKSVTVKKIAGRIFHRRQDPHLRDAQGPGRRLHPVHGPRGGWKKIKRCLKPGSMKPRKRCG